MISVELRNYLVDVDGEKLLRPINPTLCQVTKNVGRTLKRFSKRWQPIHRAVWSNYRPAGHMWPENRIFKARELS